MDKLMKTNMYLLVVIVVIASSNVLGNHLAPKSQQSQQFEPVVSDISTSPWTLIRQRSSDSEKSQTASGSHFGWRKSADVVSHGEPDLLGFSKPSSNLQAPVLGDTSSKQSLNQVQMYPERADQQSSNMQVKMFGGTSQIQSQNQVQLYPLDTSEPPSSDMPVKMFGGTGTSQTQSQNQVQMYPLDTSEPLSSDMPVKMFGGTGTSQTQSQKQMQRYPLDTVKQQTSGMQVKLFGGTSQTQLQNQVQMYPLEKQQPTFDYRAPHQNQILPHNYPSKTSEKDGPVAFARVSAWIPSTILIPIRQVAEEIVGKNSGDGTGSLMDGANGELGEALLQASFSDMIITNIDVTYDPLPNEENLGTIKGLNTVERLLENPPHNTDKVFPSVFKQNGDSTGSNINSNQIYTSNERKVLGETTSQSAPEGWTLNNGQNINELSNSNVWSTPGSTKSRRVEMAMKHQPQVVTTSMTSVFRPNLRQNGQHSLPSHPSHGPIKQLVTQATESRGHNTWPVPSDALYRLKLKMEEMLGKRPSNVDINIRGSRQLAPEAMTDQGLSLLTSNQNNVAALGLKTRPAEINISDVNRHRIQPQTTSSVVGNDVNFLSLLLSRPTPQASPPVSTGDTHTRMGRAFRVLRHRPLRTMT